MNAKPDVPLPAVSVIMPVLNEERHLRGAVQAILAQEYAGEMEVVIGAHGRPELALHGLARERAEELAVRRTWLTLTHDGPTAAAFVVLER